MQLYFKLIIFLFFSNQAYLVSQNHFNVRLKLNPETPIEKACYYLQLASADGVDLNLAGQNYRMYYDATELSYDANSSSSLLPEDRYTKLVTKDNIVDIDASGAGLLPFDNHLSFLNIGNDLKDELIGGIVLPADGSWINTANICFKRVTAELSPSISGSYDVYWARPELTDSYATAYLEIAEWISPEQTRPAVAAVYFDQKLSTSLKENQLDAMIEVYPNPTKDRVFVSINQTASLLIQLYSSTGKLIMEEKNASGMSHLDVSQLASGTYQLRLSNGQQQLLKKIEK